MAIRLSQTAPWNPALTNPYRTRYTSAAGRYFRVVSDRMDAPWMVEEITADGEFLDYVGEGGDCVVFRLADARTLIERATA